MISNQTESLLMEEHINDHFSQKKKIDGQLNIRTKVNTAQMNMISESSLMFMLQILPV